MVPYNIEIYLSMNFSSIVQNYYVYFAYVYKELSVIELHLRHFGATLTNPPFSKDPHSFGTTLKVNFLL